MTVRLQKERAGVDKIFPQQKETCVARGEGAVLRRLTLINEHEDQRPVSL